MLSSPPLIMLEYYIQFQYFEGAPNCPHKDLLRKNLPERAEGTFGATSVEDIERVSWTLMKSETGIGRGSRQFETNNLASPM